MSVFTPNLGLINMTPGSGAVAGNIWPTNENTSRQLVDDYFTSFIPVVFSGASITIGGVPATIINGIINVVSVISTNGQSDQARRRVFLISGTSSLGEVDFVFSIGQSRSFTIINGSNIQVIVAYGGSPASAGKNCIVKSSQTVQIVGDGSNFYYDGAANTSLTSNQAPDENWLQRAFLNISSSVPFANVSVETIYLPSTTATNFTPQSASSQIFLRATIDYQVQWTDGSAAGSAIMEVSLCRNGAALWMIQVGGSNLMSGHTGVSITPLGSAELQWMEASPGTSAVTYAIYCRNVGTSGLTCTALKATLQIEEVL